MKKEERIPSYRIIWGKIRYYQILHHLTDSQLATFLDVNIRTLKNYDEDAQTISLGKIENFLKTANLQIDELIAL